MTCKECRHSDRDYIRLIPALYCKMNRREFERPDLPAERCPKFEKREGQ